MAIQIKSLIIVFFLGTTILIFLSLLSNNGISDKKYVKSVDKIIKITKYSHKSIKQRGDFWVLYNFVEATKIFDYYNETITLTTPGDYRFLNNVEQLVAIWNGPISIALYAPGYDFFTTLDSIAYLRKCRNRLIRQFVTFHIFFDHHHIPPVKNQTRIIDTYTDKYDCINGPPYVKISDKDMYKSKNQLTFPINVARNIARESAKTHLVFPSDIELFPTPNFIRKFIKFTKNKSNLFTNNERNIFVLPIFEILDNETIPQTKNELQQLYQERRAFLFHQKICWRCHKIPKFEQWIKSNTSNDDEINIFTIGKRYGVNNVWEPFFISTNKEPLFDERLTWEGQSNKMSQAFALCLLNYNFIVLDNAFLTHKPGIKKKKVQVQKHKKIINNTKTILRNIRDNLIALYGDNKRCIIAYDIDK